jgi:magnesium and cobalt exporter, CNNM family
LGQGREFPMSYVLKGAVIVLLVAVNGFFVAAEYALLSVRRTRLEELSRDGQAGARQALGLLSDVGLLFSGIQLGVTVASLMMGWVGEQAVAVPLERLIEPRLSHVATLAVTHSIAATLAFLFITTVLVVLGELVPKAVAYERAERTALAVAPLMTAFLKMSRYPVRALDWLSERVLRALGHTPGQGHGPVHTLDEVKIIVSALRKRGLLAEEQEDMIRSVFDLHRILVREIMVPRPQVTCLPLTENLQSLLEHVVRDQHTRIPIYDESPEEIVGVLYSKDLLSAALERLRGGIPLSGAFNLRSILHEPMIVPETMPLIRMLDEARLRHMPMGLVVDEFGTFVGLVTVEDVVEQVVGEIQDEYDREERPAQKATEHVLHLEGSLNLRDLADDYEIVLPRGRGFETLGGFVLQRLGVIPKAGDTFFFEGRRYTVTAMDGRRVAQIKVEKAPLVPQTLKIPPKAASSPGR